MEIAYREELLKEPGSKYVRQIATDHGVSGGTVLKQKRELEEQYASDVRVERCRKLGKTTHDEQNNGWLESVKKRINILSKEICGEAADVS